MSVAALVSSLCKTKEIGVESATDSLTEKTENNDEPLTEALDDVSIDIDAQFEDLDKMRFEIYWSCRDPHRPKQPVKRECLLHDGNQHLEVRLNDVIYFNQYLRGEAKAATVRIKHERTCDKVYVEIQKKEKGMWL